MRMTAMTTALALLTTIAHADTARTAKILGLTAVYDKSCEKIPNFEGNGQINTG